MTVTALYAHIAGLPVEEAVLHLAGAGVALAAALQMAGEWARRRTGRRARRS